MEQKSKMQNLIFVYGDNQHRVSRIEKAFCYQ